MQRKTNAALIVAAVLGATIVTGGSFAEEQTTGQYPNDRANHHPLHESVAENQAVVTRLGPVTAVSYWAAAFDGWHVVTTVGTAADDTEATQPATVRFSATLLPGQEQFISIPMAAGEPAKVLRIRRQGDRIEIQQVAEPAM